MATLPSTLDDWAAMGIAGHVHYGQRAKALPYKRKINLLTEKASALIARWWEQVEGRGYVSISFGKDSLVAWHLAQRVAPVPVVWVNQGPLAEWPDCLRLREVLEAEHGMEVVELQPDVSLTTWYQQHGIPRSAAMDSAEDKALNEALMYAPLRRFQEAGGWQGFLWGLRGVNEPHREGRHRTQYLNRYGVLHHRSDGQWVGSPVAWWTTHQIWAYIDLHGLPYPAMYDIDRQQIRNGPPMGTSGLQMGRIAKLHRHFPEIYRIVACAFPELTRLG